MRKLFVGALAALMFAGCSSTPTQDAAPVEERAPDASATAPGSGGASTAGTATSGISGTPSGSATTLSPLKDPKSILSQRNIYFDYDSYVVKTEHRALVEAHAKYLQANRSARMIIQGNTDERGTREYNIALGQKRADAIKKMLLLLGATESQVETVSFGKEKPRNPGSGESAWAENRRGDIVYAGE
jgi:peptidoglycan-associated lipoprotein